MRKLPFMLLILLTPFAPTGEPPEVVNGDFEVDHYANPPGYTTANGGILTGWETEGHVGVNPCWTDAKRLRHPKHLFSDNGTIPSGKQVLFIQNAGAVKQNISGFKAGRKYKVVYSENGRAVQRSSAPPVLTVTLNGEVIVSPHPVPPVAEENNRKVPYANVESAVFVPEIDGDCELVFRTSRGGGTSVLIDDIRLEQID